MGKLISMLAIIAPTQSAFINTVIQGLVFEIIMFISIPLLGILIESVIVKGIRGVFARIIGGRLENAFANYVLFAGVMIHELSHAFFALITGAKITEIALFAPEGNSLGHVEFSPRGNKFFQALQLSFSACAPVVTGMIITSFIATKVFPAISQTWQWIICIYLFLSVLFHMNMSKPDLKCYFKGALPILAVGLPLCLIFVF